MSEKFVKLTASASGFCVYLPVGRIVSIFQAPYGSKVFTIEGDDGWTVKETPEEILAQLQPSVPSIAGTQWPGDDSDIDLGRTFERQEIRNALAKAKSRHFWANKQFSPYYSVSDVLDILKAQVLKAQRRAKDRKTASEISVDNCQFPV